MNRLIIYLLLAAGCASSAFAQDSDTQPTETKTSSKAWEVGIGGSAFQFSRASFSNFNKLSDGGYRFDLRLSHAVYGGNIYVARELTPHFYIDLQGTAGFTTQSLGNDDKNKWMFMIGPGLQWRLGEYFDSKYIDPYLRAGISYMYKDFSIFYEGEEGLAPDEMSWILENIKNKEGVDRKHMMPISLGGGLNMWMNDNIGIGMQADYLIMPYKNVANSLQGTVRLMWRIGGESKKPQPEVKYVEVEKIVEKEVIVEKIVEKEVPVDKEIEQLCDFFNNIHFDFDKSTITPQSERSLSQIATVLKRDTSRRYLISGFTDSKGSAHYNSSLSRRRAEAVVKALIDRGVPANMLKSRGLGNKVSYAAPSASNSVREGDRKVTVELISNVDYWNYLK